VVETTVVEITVVRKKINRVYLDYNKNLLKKQI